MVIMVITVTFGRLSLSATVCLKMIFFGVRAKQSKLLNVMHHC